MTCYAIIEAENGLLVANYADIETAEDAAKRLNGFVVDPGPYRSYDDAYDALLALQRQDEEE
jgi:hypothetical protein